MGTKNKGRSGNGITWILFDSFESERFEIDNGPIGSTGDLSLRTERASEGDWRSRRGEYWTHIEGEIEDVGHGGILPVLDRLRRCAQLRGVASRVNSNSFRFLGLHRRRRGGGRTRSLRRSRRRHCGLRSGGGGGGGELGDSFQSNLLNSSSALSLSALLHRAHLVLISQRRSLDRLVRRRWGRFHFNEITQNCKPTDSPIFFLFDLSRLLPCRIVLCDFWPRHSRISKMQPLARVAHLPQSRPLSHKTTPGSSLSCCRPVGRLPGPTLRPFENKGSRFPAQNLSSARADSDNSSLRPVGFAMTSYDLSLHARR